MFWPDVIQIKQFYQTPLGQITCRALRRRLRTLWPDTRNQTMLGYGFTTPYLLPFRDEAERLIACMPVTQGVMHWPHSHPNQTLLCEEADWPIPDQSVDHLIIAHGLEHCEQTRYLMNEIRRVLSPGGKVLIIVPNRRGMWARFENTPFGYGRPYTAGQVQSLLNYAELTVSQTQYAMFIPPGSSRLMFRFSGMVEAIGEMVFPLFGGILLVEAEKQLYAPVNRQTERVRKPILMPTPQTAMSGN